MSPLRLRQEFHLAFTATMMPTSPALPNTRPLQSAASLECVQVLQLAILDAVQKPVGPDLRGKLQETSWFEKFLTKNMYIGLKKPTPI